MCGTCIPASSLTTTPTPSLPQYLCATFTTERDFVNSLSLNPLQTRSLSHHDVIHHHSLRFQLPPLIHLKCCKQLSQPAFLSHALPLLLNPALLRRLPARCPHCSRELRRADIPPCRVSQGAVIERQCSRLRSRESRRRISRRQVPRWQQGCAADAMIPPFAPSLHSKSLLGAYYFLPAAAPSSSTKWRIFFEGGGWCASPASHCGTFSLTSGAGAFPTTIASPAAARSSALPTASPNFPTALLF